MLDARDLRGGHCENVWIVFLISIQYKNRYMYNLFVLKGWVNTLSDKKKINCTIRNKFQTFP